MRWATWWISLLLVYVHGDDFYIIETDTFSLDSQKWQYYNISTELVDWDDGQVPFVTLVYPTVASSGLPLALYAVLGDTQPTVNAPYSTKYVDIDSVAGTTTLTMYLTTTPTGDVQIGVYNPNTNVNKGVSNANITIFYATDYQLDFGPSPDDSIDTGTFQLYHIDVTQQQVASKLNLYFGLATAEDDLEGFTVYAKLGDYALPHHFDFNITFQSFTDDGTDSMYIWIPQDQLKAGTWYFYVSAMDGEDDTLSFSIETQAVQNVALTGKPYHGSLLINDFREFCMQVDPTVVKNSPCIVDLTFLTFNYKDVDLYAQANTIATYENHDYESCSTDRASVKELVLPPGVGSSAPNWCFQVENNADPSVNASTLTFILSAAFFPISAMSFTLPLYQLQSITLNAQSYYYLVTHDLDEKGAVLLRVIVTLDTNTKGTDLMILGRDADIQPDRSIPTELNHQYVNTPINKADQTVTYCVTTTSSFSQPAYIALYNAGTDTVLALSVTLDFPSACTDPFSAPPSTSPTTNDNNGGSIGFGGLGEYGLIAVVAGGVLTTIFAICCMHKWIRGKEARRVGGAYLQDNRPSAPSHKAPKKGKGDRYAPLNNDDDRLTAVEDL